MGLDFLGVSSWWGPESNRHSGKRGGYSSLGSPMPSPTIGRLALSEGR